MVSATINNRPVALIYANGATLEGKPEGDNIFLREKLNGKFKLLGADYTWFDTQLYNAVHDIVIIFDDGTTYTGQIKKCDCEFDDGNKSVLLSIKPNDQYEAITNALTKEISIADFSPKRVKVQYDKRGYLQFYKPGSDKITTYYCGTSFETDVKNVTEAADLASMGFVRTIQTLEAQISGGSFPELIRSSYFSVNPIAIGDLFGATDFISNINNFTLSITEGYTENYFNVRVWDGATLIYSGDDLPMPLVDTLVVNRVGNPYDKIRIKYNAHVKYEVWVRVVTNNVDFSNGVLEIPAVDVCGNNRAYQYIANFNFGSNSVVVPSTNSSDIKNAFGLNDYEKYFDKPDQDNAYFPVVKNNWANVSYWFNPDVVTYESATKTETILNDAYTLADVINSILAKYVSGITFEATKAYSEFLYSKINPVTYEQFELLVTQKTNLIVSDYEGAAKNGNISLKHIFDYLWIAHKCKWHLEGTKLRIEHIQYYRNGLTYLGTPGITANLKADKDIRNNQVILKGQSKYKYENVNHDEFVETKYNDNISDIFAGQQIISLGTNINKGNTTTLSIQNINPDIDDIVINNNDENNGFAVIAAYKNNSFNCLVQVGTQYGNWINPASGIVEVNTSYNVSYRVGVNPEWFYLLTQDITYRMLDINNQYLGFGTTTNKQLTLTNTAVAYLELSIPIAAWEYFQITHETTLYKTEYTTVAIDGYNYTVQNGKLTFPHLHALHYVYDAFTRLLKINGVQTTAISVVRSKIQDVVFQNTNLDNSVFEPGKLVTTDYGNGVVQEYSRNLTTDEIKAKLGYEPE